MSGVAKEESYYAVLELSSTASLEDIEQAYARIIAFLAPDSLAMYSMVSDEDLEVLRAKVDAAYRTLSDPASRAAYDEAVLGVDQGIGSSYPSVMVPEAAGRSSISVGTVEGGRREEARAEPPSPHRAPPRPAPMASVVRSAAATQGGDAAAPRPILPASVREGPKAGAPRRFVVPPEARELHPDMEISGAFLRRLREVCGASLEEVAELTKVSKRYLRAIEDNDFDSLPAPVYVRGFVREYARAFGVDPETVATSYLALFRRYRGGGG